MRKKQLLCLFKIWSISSGISGRIKSEWVVGNRRNGWSDYTGISGRLTPESVVGLHRNTQFELIFTLESFYKVSREEIKELLSPLLDLRGLKLSDKEVFKDALVLFIQKNNLSFADAFNAAFAIKKGIKEVYSYDTDFDKVEGIERVVP